MVTHEVIHVLPGLIVVIISQCISTSNYHVAHLKYIRFLSCSQLYLNKAGKNKQKLYYFF